MRTLESPASDAVKVLDDAGIPCEVTAVEISSALDRQLAEYEYRVMVPAPLNLKARSILDKEIFNPQLEADWRLHFQSLTERDLRRSGGPHRPFEARLQ